MISSASHCRVTFCSRSGLFILLRFCVVAYEEATLMDDEELKPVNVVRSSTKFKVDGEPKFLDYFKAARYGLGLQCTGLVSEELNYATRLTLTISW